MSVSTRGSFLLGLVGLIGLISPVAAYPPKHATIHVHHGQSIQAAIELAKPYDEIIVGQGTYEEQLTVAKDGITLVGHNAKLVPPSTPVNNTCSGLAGSNPFTKLDTQAGICIEGLDVALEPYASEHRKFISVVRRVKDVRVTGFTISGFDGLDIAIVGATGTTVCENHLTDGYTYGALSVGSKKSVIERNVVFANPPVAPNTFLSFIAICMDDISSVTVAYNSINGYNIGLCVQTDGAHVHDNHVENSCIGAYVDPGVVGAQILHNEIKNTNPLCRENATVSGAFGVWGVAVGGARKTLVKGNHISGISDGFGTDKAPAAGVAVFDDYPPPFGTADVASGNVVVDNVIVHNDLDVSITATGSGNVEHHNICKTSTPAGLCKH